MITYEKIKSIRGKDNKNIIEVLRYIATKEKYIICGNIQYRKLYYNVLKKAFIATAQQKGLNKSAVSMNQYKHLRKYKRGKFSINIAIYLLALYRIMLSYDVHTDLTPKEDDISYTTYILNELKNEILFIVNNSGNEYIDEERAEIYSQISQELFDLDQETGNNKNKIYNNIW